jgi:phosphoserine phosphatase RsbU/P
MTDDHDLLGDLLDSAHFAIADQLPGVVDEVAKRAGWSIAIFVADYDQQTLRALSRDRLGEEHPIDGSLPGRCFRLSEPIVIASRQSEAWIPLIDNVDRLGVLHVRLPTGEDLGDTTTAAKVRHVAYLIGHLIAVKAPFADHLHLARLNRPRSLESELIWSLLPPMTVACRGLVIAGALEPSHAVAGDMFDYAVDSDVAHIAITDATGHDLEAALIGALVLGAYRASRRSGQVLEDIVSSIDAALASHAADAYATGVVAELDRSTGRLRYVNAGHPAPLLLRGGKIVRELGSGRRPLFGLPRPAVVATEQLEAGDWIVFYTDGLVEARDSERGFFGLPRLIDIIERCAADGQNASETLRRVIHAVLDHQANVLQDDATLVILQWNTGLEHELTST